MPRLIDHAKRQEELAEATWRVILRDGISAVSIRTVAAEAGVSTGSLRHIFPSKTDLLVYAMQLVDERAGMRIEAHLEEPDPRRLVLSVIRELLPLDAQRRAEMEVNIALIAEARTDERMKQVRDDAYQVLRAACRRMLAHLRDNGLTDPGINLDEAATALHGLVDGLATHLLINNDPGFEQQVLQAVTAHLDSLR